MHIINFTVAIIISIADLVLLWRRTHKKIVELGNIYDHPEWKDNKVVTDLLRSHEVAIFTTITMIFQAVGFMGLYGLSKIQGKLSEVISTGIHIPFALIFTGLLIKGVSSLFVKDFEIDQKNVILICSLALCCSLAILDWKLFLLTLAIILGKYIWIDAVYDWGNIKKEMGKIIRLIRSCAGAEYMALQISLRFLFFFVVYTLIYMFLFNQNPGLMVFVYFVSLVSTDITDSTQTNVDNAFIKERKIQKALKTMKIESDGSMDDDH